MKAICKVCGNSFDYEPIQSLFGAKLSDLKPSICSMQCESRFNEERQREVSKNVFYRVLNVLPDAYKGVRMSDFDEMELLSQYNQSVHKGAEDIIKRFCNSEYWSISLFSPITGNGKTRLGLYILACLALKGKYRMRELATIQDAGYYSAIDIAKILKTETYDAKQYNLKRFYRSKVLMIDDLGQEPKQFSPEIAGILKVREETYRKTIITSNLTKEELEERYTNRVYSRIYKGAFLMNGTDRRIQK